MVHFRIHFSYPLLLLVFLLGLAITALLYFRLSKKYRKNRNRVTSTVLHLIVFALAVLTMAGTMFTYEVPNKENQIILLVDVSDTEEQSREARDAFVKTILDMGQYDGFSIGIVTFGYNQVYAVEMTDKISVSDMMNRYQSAEQPDTSATDIAAALTYTADLFTNPEAGRIVLVTDGKETDEKASSVIRSVSARGIGVDVANIPSAYEGSDMQLVGAVLPDYHVSPGAGCVVAATLYAQTAGDVRVEFFDNGNLVSTQDLKAAVGTQNVTFNHTFTGAGLHTLSFRLSTGTNDVLKENNTYYTYMNLENFDNVLILEHKNGESDRLKALLTEGENAYKVTVKNIRTDRTVPTTTEEMRQYDQVILNNIARADMPEGFEELLQEYVSVYGGGLFTVGGADEQPGVTGDDRFIAHAYNREDMWGSIYQELLPVQAIKYTPPIGLMVIVDRSGSMSEVDGSTGSTYYELALSGARGCLEALTERDYFGLMTLDSDYETLLPLTPRSQDNKIKKAIFDAQELGPTGGTVFPDAIERASRALLSLNVARRHVIIVTDGQVPEKQEKEYLDYIQKYHKNNGITYSVVGIGVAEGSAAATQMKTACDAGGGRLYALMNGTSVTESMREDLRVPDIKEVNYDTYYPTVRNTLSTLLNGIKLSTTEDGHQTPKMTASLDGFFGVKVKDGAELVLMGDYDVPVYAQWKYGKGTVGSFMCDLNGTWSSDFLTETTENNGSGRQFIRNVVSALMPMESVRENQITVNIETDNYTNLLSVFSQLGDGERIVGYLKNMADASGTPLSLNEVTAVPEGERLESLACYVTSALSAANKYSRAGFVIKQAGVYELSLQKVDEAGNVLAEYTTYRSFSYSEEYDQTTIPTNADLAVSLAALAKNGGGSLIVKNEDPIEVFANFVTSVQKSFDPRYLFMILALILFLADVAVRKFKFKWPHELIRAHREKVQKKKGGSDQ